MTMPSRRLEPLTQRVRLLLGNRGYTRTEIHHLPAR
jgi:hypothetical protein